MPGYSGQSVGRYHVIEQLGTGGMATVYKAFDTRLERYVAIKFIRKEAIQDETFLKRFEREAKALAILSHPNIVKIMDYGEHQGAPYLVMEYISGGTMKNLLGTPLPWLEAVKLLIPITSALEYTHQHGIIHRDVKPSNFLISDAGIPMLSDFGIAKMIETSSNVQLTALGVGIGTPEYMAPEQGQGAAVDGRVDIYALGIVLYELVTGKKPFRADTPLAVVVKHISSPLPDPRIYVPTLPDALIQVIFKALAKKPEDRFQSMTEFEKSLERLLQEPPTAQQRLSVATRTDIPPAAASVEPPPVQYNYAQDQKRPDAMPAAGSSATPYPPPQYHIPVPGTAPAYRAEPSYHAPPPEMEAQPAKKSKWMVGVLIPLIIFACLLVIVLAALLFSIWNKNNAAAMENATSTSVAQTAEEQRDITGTARSERNTQEAQDDFATETAEALTQTASAQMVHATQTAQSLTSTAQAFERTSTALAQQQGGSSQNSEWVTIIDDYFNDSTNWEIGPETNDYWTGFTEIGNGLLTWDATSIQGFVDYLDADIGYQEDLRLFVRARQVSGQENVAYGAYFHNNEDGDKYYFSINSNTQVCNLYTYVNSGWVTIFSQTDLNIHTTGSGLFNEFTIVRQGNKIEIYINDDQQPVRVVQDDTLQGGWLGLAIELTNPGNHAVFQFDQFQLSVP